MHQETFEERIERQKAIEQDALTLGAARYRSNRLDWHEDTPGKSEEADLAPGKLLLKKHVEAVADALAEYLGSVVAGRAVHKSAAAQYLIHVDPLQAAYIALRFALNAGSGAPLSTVARQIGEAIQEHLEMLRMAKEHPGLYRKLSNQLARSTSAKHRIGVLRHVREKYDLSKMGWSVRDRIQIGMKMLDLILATTPLFKQWKHAVSGRGSGRGNRKPKTPQLFSFNEETLEWLEKAHGRCELLSPIHLPMIVPPRPWRTPFAGGYLTNALHPRLVRTRNRDYLNELGGIDLSEVMRAVNTIQETPWRISRRVLDVLDAEMEAGGGEAGLPRKSDAPLPPRPLGIPAGVKESELTVQQREALVVWKAKAAKVHEENAAAKRDRVVLEQKRYVARRFVVEPVIYFPHYLDFRGRVYPMASYLNPQSDDIGRGLLEFAEGKPLGEDGAFWLAVHIAGVWGVDKVTFDERVQWVHDNEEQILASALDPLENRFWTTADNGTKPWQGLAACFEWLGYKLNGDAHVSHLPIAMDGTCSGLQHYSALLRDEIGGAAVNLVPAERPADIYTTVAKRAQALSDGSLGGTKDAMARAWQGKFCRKVAKQPTMTLCYSATKMGMKGQIEKALGKLDEDGHYLAGSVENHHAALYAAEVILDALGDTVVAARRAMAWLQEVSALMTEAGLPIRWTAPCGLPVLQDYRETVGEVVNAYIGGKRLQLQVHADTERRSRPKQSSGIAPNFVHSLDASHLLATVNIGKDNGLRHFAVIHDSFAVHAADTSMLNAVIREAFVRQYEEPVLERFRDEIVAQLQAAAPELVEKVPKLPRYGSLDIQAVRNSEFFFA